MNSAKTDSVSGWAVLLLIAATAGVFAQTWQFKFLRWDDDRTIATRADFHPPAPEKIGTYWRTAVMDLYVPVTYTAWMSIAQLAHTSGGTLNPGVFHLANIVVHINSVLVVFLILRRLIHSGLAACAGAMVFAIHPLQVEAVSWISGFKDVLSGMFALLAIWLYLVGTDEERPRVVVYIIATVVFVLAMLAKPSAVAVPIVAVTIDRFMCARSWKSIAKSVGPWFVLCIPIVIIGKLVQPTSEVLLPYTPLWARPLVALDALAFYLRKLIFPLKLAIDYGRSPSWLITSRDVLITPTLDALLISLIWLLRRRTKVIAAAAAVFAGALLPVLGFLPFDFQGFSTVADHYVYVAMLGVAIAVTAIVQTRSRMAIAIIAVLILAFGTKSFLQTRAWRDSETLFQHTLTVNPASLAANVNLGNFRKDAAVSAKRNGDRARAESLFGAAARYYDAALVTSPRDAITLYNYGLLFQELGQPDSAKKYYRAAIQSNPHDTNSHNNLGLLLRDENPPEAEREFRAAIESAPTNVDAHSNLALVLSSRGANDEAIAEYETAIRYSPEMLPARLGLAKLLIRRNDIDGAFVQFQHAVLIDPKSFEARMGYGALLAQKGNISSAIQQIEAALQLKPDSKEALDQLNALRRN